MVYWVGDDRKLHDLFMKVAQPIKIEPLDFDFLDGLHNNVSVENKRHLVRLTIFVGKLRADGDRLVCHRACGFACDAILFATDCNGANVAEGVITEDDFLISPLIGGLLMLRNELLCNLRRDTDERAIGALAVIPRLGLAGLRIYDRNIILVAVDDKALIDLLAPLARFGLKRAFDGTLADLLAIDCVFVVDANHAVDHGKLINCFIRIAGLACLRVRHCGQGNRGSALLIGKNFNELGLGN